MAHLKIGLIGLGLIGGSLAKTFRRKLPDTTIIAVDSDETSLMNAHLDGTLDGYTTTLDYSFCGCQYIFLCAPVGINIRYLSLLKDLFPADTNCIITDVSSIKTEIHEAVHDCGLQNHFIGGHPMAGLETSGYEHANGYLFENVYYILTPEAQVEKEQVDSFAALLQSLDMLPIILNCKDHDYATACVSHLPHIISAGLVNLVKNADWPNQVMKSIAAGGFKDITRISSSDPDMWKQICLGNKEQILPLLDQYVASLGQLKAFIEKEDVSSLKEYFESAKNYRDSISDTATGALLKSYRLYADLKDETGQIATVATILATHGISIKNIGILHNREFEQGVLRIEFYDSDALLNALKLLRDSNYHIYER